MISRTAPAPQSLHHHSHSRASAARCARRDRGRRSGEPQPPESLASEQRVGPRSGVCLPVNGSPCRHCVGAARRAYQRQLSRHGNAPFPQKKLCVLLRCPFSLSTGIDAQSPGSTEKNYSLRAVAQHDSRDRQGAGDGFLRSRSPHHAGAETKTLCEC